MGIYCVRTSAGAAQNVFMHSSGVAEVVFRCSSGAGKILSRPAFGGPTFIFSSLSLSVFIPKQSLLDGVLAFSYLVPGSSES